MLSQPNLLLSNAPPSNGLRRPATPRPVPPRRNWLRLVELLLRVIVRLYLGLILVILPWTHFWSENRFFLYFSFVARIAISGPVRGFVSGLGLLNIWIAVSDAVRHKEE
jgi:hypothetical protein